MTCKICQIGSAVVQEINGVFRVKCRRCGAYRIDRNAADDWQDGVWGGLTPRQRANACGWIRQNEGVYVVGDMLDFLKQVPEPTVTERADKLLIELERRSNTPGTGIAVHDTEENSLDYLGVAWAVDLNELKFLAKTYLTDTRNFLHILSAGGVYVVLPEGYVYLERLRRTNIESDIGFAAMWFDPDLTPLWLEGIEPAIAAARYRPVRIDRHEHNNRIDDEIIAMIRKSRFMVADFTGHRGGVYFEAGLALGLGLPVIWTCRNDSLNDLHFDTRQYNFLTWTPEEKAAFQGRLTNRIEATIGRGSYRRRGDQ